MIYIRFLLIAIFMSVSLETYPLKYTGPTSAGVEFYEKGKYQIKGYVQCNSQKKCTLYPYYETSREYKVFLTGRLTSKKVVKPGYYAVTGHVLESSIGHEMFFFVQNKLIKISDAYSLVNTVKKL